MNHASARSLPPLNPINLAAPTPPPSATDPPTNNNLPGEPSSFFKTLDGYMDNLANADTNEQAVLDQIIANNTIFFTVNAKLISTNNRIITENTKL